MQVTRKGTIFEVPGIQPKVGDQAKEFELKSLDDKVYRLADFLGKPTILSIVPDIDTRVCALQTKRFNEEASKIDEVNFVTISNNTKEEQANWCAAEGVKNMQLLSDKAFDFGKNAGLYVADNDTDARSVWVLDNDGKVLYRELVIEQTNEPDYESVLQFLDSLA